ncbi:cytochrome-c peroxidase [Nevskia soli]|uniref:cytochrome-c peroxidase n=1 Tax=Nevskia soli TaxID=418856 RepID=UPI0004A6B44D|nr:cytochrome c peroxidase [Nevskia soli]
MFRTLHVLGAAFFVAGAASAADWQALPTSPPSPADNPTTPAKVELGKMLYFDPRLSSTGTISCFSCHNVMEGGDDHRPTSVGVHGQLGGRNAPTVWNAAFQSVQFWDGRAPSLEAQAKGPIVNPIEMGMPKMELAVDRIRRIPGYKTYFERAFGADPEISADTIAKAIAAYERTLITPNSPYDRFVKGEKTALSTQQQRGMQAFADVGCTACHSGANFSGPSLAEGTGFFMKFPTYLDNPYVARYHLLDDGGKAVQTGKKEDQNVWRVPTLRNLVYTAPYFHNGQVTSLPDAVRVMAATQLNKNLPDSQIMDITAFLESLSGEFPQQQMPRLPPTPGDMLQ